MKKRLFGIFICLAMVALCVVGCGSNDADTTDAGGDVEEVTQRTVYVSPAWVNAAKNGEVPGYEDVVVAEVGYGNVKDCESYNKGHVPGAIYVDICEVEDATGDETGAYNLLPAADVEKGLLSHGITKDTKVVLYMGDQSGVGRQAYGYLWAGVEDVKILNGGIDAWTAAGFDTETTVNEAEAATDFGTTVPAHPEYWVSIEEAKEKVASDDNFKLVSIRSEDEWLGKTSGYDYMDKAGEPEGAVWGKGAETAFDVAQLVNDDGTVISMDQLQELWADCDFTVDNQLAFYCGTGWRASVPFLIMYDAGYDNISMYDGGWYEWIMHDDYPVQVGDPASDDCVHTTVGELPNDKAATY